MNLQQMLEGAARAQQTEAPRILPEAAIATLREALSAYRTTCPYAPGALVTPRSWAVYRGAGSDPFIVLDLARPDYPNYTPCDESEISMHSHGIRPDILIAAYQYNAGMGQHVVSTHWVSSWCYEPWVGTPNSTHPS